MTGFCEGGKKTHDERVLCHLECGFCVQQISSGKQKDFSKLKEREMFLLLN